MAFIQPRKNSREPLTIKQYNDELAEAETEFKHGEYITHEELLKEIKKWEENHTG